VADDGRGIPVDVDADSGKGAVEVVMTQIHAGVNFDRHDFKTSGVLRGCGLTAVNALSAWLKAEIRRDGYLWRQEFERGKPTNTGIPLEHALRTRSLRRLGQLRSVATAGPDYSDSLNHPAQVRGQWLAHICELRCAETPHGGERGTFSARLRGLFSVN
jgi:hypothetical protein